MEDPICFSKYFVNKQNVRSYRNVMKFKIMRCDNIRTFCFQVLQDEKLVTELPSPFLEIFYNLKTNLQNCCKQDFRNYFDIASRNDKATYMSPVEKETIFTKCWNASLQIIPKSLFGNNHNLKIFWKIVKVTVYSMYRQHILLQNFLKQWDLAVHPWNMLSKDVAMIVLSHALMWVLKCILSPMICINFYVTTCKLDADEYKLYYFWKHHWQSFYDGKVSAMMFTKIIKKCEPYCLSKRIKMGYSYRENRRLQILKKSIPKLHMVLKQNNECRPIIKFRNETLSASEKYRIKERLSFLKHLTQISEKKIITLYHELYLKWVSSGKPELYFIKTDLSNAFGSINREKLMKILAEKHLHFQKCEKNFLLKKKVAQQYKDMINELRKPLLIRAGSTVFEWKKGLVQGYKYSPALSELYYSYYDCIYLKEHLVKSENGLRLFIRVVDDYLYVTDSMDDALAFLVAISNYKNINYNKTVVSFVHDYIKYNEEFNFLGFSYNTKTLRVKRAINVFAGQMCYKIAFTLYIKNLYKFIESRIGQSGTQISAHIFNLHYNTEEEIWEHIFSSLCLSANKFCTILSLLCEEAEMRNFLLLYKKKVTVKLCDVMINVVLKNKPMDVSFLYCINHFRYLSWKALYLCARDTSKCSVLITFIKKEINKSNCLYGRWKEHSSRIDVDGESLCKATKEICRRTELKEYFNNYEKLPGEVECFQQNVLKNM